MPLVETPSCDTMPRPTLLLYLACIFRWFSVIEFNMYPPFFPPGSKQETSSPEICSLPLHDAAFSTVGVVRFVPDTALNHHWLDNSGTKHLGYIMHLFPLVSLQQKTGLTTAKQNTWDTSYACSLSFLCNNKPRPTCVRMCVVFLRFMSRFGSILAVAGWDWAVRISLSLSEFLRSVAQPEPEPPMF